MKIVIFLMMLFAVCPAVAETPKVLGFHMGQKFDGDPDGLASNGVMYRNAENLYGFDSLVAYYGENAGVCSVKAIRIAETSNYGEGIRSAADDLAGKLSSKYGEPTNKFDLLRAGSIWNEPRHWIMGLRKGERFYAYSWEQPGEGISVIMVESKPNAVTLQYDFVNSDECHAEASAELESAL